MFSPFKIIGMHKSNFCRYRVWNQYFFMCNIDHASSVHSILRSRYYSAS